jgi:hypothetical protein
MSDAPLPETPANGIGPENASPPPDDRTARAETPETIAMLEKRRYVQQTKHFEAEHETRLRLLGRLYTLLQQWLVFVVAVVFAQGFLGPAGWVHFQLSDNVLLAILGVTTVNVLGVFLVAARYVFNPTARWMDDIRRPKLPRRVPKRLTPASSRRAKPKKPPA